MTAPTSATRADGLVLKQTLRDLPRPEGHPAPQTRPEAINFDYGARVHLRLDGAVLNRQAGTWAIRPSQEKREGMERGYDCRLRGELVYDTAARRFARFYLVAAGERWGGTEHNNRQEDLPPSPMGIVFQLADDTPPTAPHPTRTSGSTSTCRRTSAPSNCVSASQSSAFPERFTTCFRARHAVCPDALYVPPVRASRAIIFAFGRKYL